jgi:hypothetical protein
VKCRAWARIGPSVAGKLFIFMDFSYLISCYQARQSGGALAGSETFRVPGGCRGFSWTGWNASTDAFFTVRTGAYGYESGPVP